MERGDEGIFGFEFRYSSGSYLEQKSSLGVNRIQRCIIHLVLKRKEQECVQLSDISLFYLMRTQSTHTKEIHRSLESMLNHISSQDSISYFEFLVMARQLQLRFESASDLAWLKQLFESQVVTKLQIKEILVFRHKQVENNNRIQMVGINQSHSKPLLQERNSQVDAITRKITFLKSQLQETYGPDVGKWFRAFDLESKSVIGIYEMRWVLSYMLGQEFKESEVKMLFGSLSVGNGIPLEQFKRMFDQEHLIEKLRGYLRSPVRVDGAVAAKEFPFRMMLEAGQVYSHKRYKNRLVPHLIKYYKRDKIPQTSKTGAQFFSRGSSLGLSQFNKRRSTQSVSSESTPFLRQVLKRRHAKALQINTINNRQLEERSFQTLIGRRKEQLHNSCLVERKHLKLRPKSSSIRW